jgi:PAS domain S-box-containing protein
MNQRVLPIVLVCIIGIGAALYLFTQTQKIEFQKAREKFTEIASERFHAIESQAFDKLTIERAIVALYNSSNYVSYSEFRTFIETISASGTNFQAMSWISVINDGSRQDFIDKIRKEGLSDFIITERSKDGKLIPAITRELYYPVTYIVPFKGNEGASGFNLGSNPVRLAALEAARDTGQAVLSGKLNLVQLKEDNAGVLLFMPVYRNWQNLNTKEQRRQNLMGYISGVIQISSLLSSLSEHHHDVSGSKRTNINVYLFDESAKNNQLLYFHSVDDKKQLSNQIKLADLKADVYHEHSFIIGQRKWTLIATPDDPTFSGSLSYQRWVIFFLALIFTFGIVAYLVQSQRRTLKIEALVNERTTQLNKTAWEAQKNEEKVEAILNNTAEAIITIDEKGIIQSANKTSEIIFGYREDELINKNIAFLISANVWEKLTDDSDNMLTDQEPGNRQATEIEGHRKRGSSFPMEINVTSIITDNQKLFIANMHDITERKQAEIQKSEFVSTISHELRTPLTSIKGSLGLVLGNAMGEISDETRNILDLAFNNCERQIRLVNDLLDMEKLSAGKMEFHKDNLDLHNVIKESVELNKDYGMKFNVSFKFEESVFPALIYADKDKLLQVLANLLSNAAKFSPEGGEVTITLAEQDEMYRVNIIDEGSGIPEDCHGKIFQRFSQADSSDTRKIGGTGLGLFITKTIIEAHDGHINFESIVDQGTTFYFLIKKLKTAM